MIPPPVFQLEHVHKRFGNFHALHDITLNVTAGEHIALVGASGAGKSTLLGLLNGSLRPDRGRVYLMGHNVETLNARQLRAVQRQIGTVYQQFHLVNTLPVIHNVNAGNLGRWSFVKALWSLIRPQEVERTAAALDAVGILDKLYERTSKLSGGQQQRVALARVLVQNPQAILADEPIASLDPGRSREVMNLFRDLANQTGKTLIASLHDISFAQSHYQRIVGLQNGRVLFDTPASTLTENMIHAVYARKEMTPQNVL